MIDIRNVDDLAGEGGIGGNIGHVPSLRTPLEPDGRPVDRLPGAAFANAQRLIIDDGEFEKVALARQGIQGPPISGRQTAGLVDYHLQQAVDVPLRRQGHADFGQTLDNAQGIGS